MDDQLQRYLDNEMGESEKATFISEISRSSLLQERLKNLESVHEFLQRKAKMEIPSKNFTQKVMSGLDAKPSIFIMSPRNGLYLLAGILVASGILVSLISGGVFNDLTTTLAIDNPLVKQEVITTPKFSLPFDGKTIIKSILLVNMALAFIMLDRTILRPLFQKRSMGF
jgi:hypothetical protein